MSLPAYLIPQFHYGQQPHPIKQLAVMARDVRHCCWPCGTVHGVACCYHGCGPPSRRPLATLPNHASWAVLSAHMCAFHTTPPHGACRPTLGMCCPLPAALRMGWGWWSCGARACKLLQMRLRLAWCLWLAWTLRKWPSSARCDAAAGPELFVWRASMLKGGAATMSSGRTRDPGCCGLRCLNAVGCNAWMLWVAMPECCRLQCLNAVGCNAWMLWVAMPECCRLRCLECCGLQCLNAVGWGA